MERVNLKNQLDDDRVKHLLAFALGPSTKRLSKALEEYERQANLGLFGFKKDKKIVGCIGIEMPREGKTTLRHIAVFPELRCQGIGRRMIQQIVRDLSLKRLEAETDRDAVDFYRKLGFTVTNLGEKYPGVIRYLCTFAI